METTMVIKVKFGDTLRRFNASLNVNGELELDMAGLRAKILSLFNFPPEADLLLTYVDEDGDVVTLVENEDLRDVMRQSLKFLRIDVQLSCEKGGKSHASSSGSSTPLRSPQVQQPLVNINRGVLEILKSLPQPLSEPLSKLSLEMASKATSGQVLAEVVDFLSKIGQCNKNTVSCTHAGGDSSRTQDVADGLNATKNGDTGKFILVNSGAKNSSDVNTGSVTPLPTVDLNLPPRDSNPSGCTSQAPVAQYVAALDDCLKALGCDESKSVSIPTRPRPSTNVLGNPFNQCPFSGMPMVNEPAMPNPIHPFKRNHGRSAPLGGMFHRGIQCDGCGVHPIVGPRYKSKVREDFDLCSICFGEMGNETDYIRMDRPVPFRHPRSFKGLHDQPQVNGSFIGGPGLHNLYKASGTKLGRPKLDSRFILDVNVVDNTLMAPSTRFTKIWRMRNNGSLTWPRGTELVWIGGDKYSDALSVEVEIPAEGVPVDQERDIAVDFTAPASPGRYISYWRMASSSGQKFGQRVWVLIQVDASLTESVCDSLETLNLNLPPATDGELLQPSSSITATEPTKPVVDEPSKRDHDLNFPINDNLLVGHGVSSSATQEAVSYPIIDLSAVSLSVPTRAPPTAFGAPAQSPSSAAPAQSPTRSAPPLVPSKVVDGPSSAEGAIIKNPLEESLLKELEEMGFKQINLNKEVLRRNEYNLEQSLDHLCGVAEWDPILEELQEMGFRDNETNKRLLVKNNGSIKRVVMDLISGEKA